MTAQIIHAFTASPARAPRMSVGRAWALVCAMHRARQSRRMLAEMDARLLADIGTSPADAQMEASRPFWDLGAR